MIALLLVAIIAGNIFSIAQPYYSVSIFFDTCLIREIKNVFEAFVES